eukprot:TRINITY_DN2008_c0_g4_i1.p1 TRINITY_DN2008_c0_g4~~TRINITY_DN2008_c0_g4_i1.p1  ORF type:complete len:700 (-),score=166.98 TRINITY_DN2008_c0_g4_i1:163-2262(-)
MLSSIVPFLVKYVTDGAIKTNNQIQAAFDALKPLGGAKVVVADFEKECGVGVVVTDKEIEDEVAKIIVEKKDEIQEKRYQFNKGVLVAGLKKALPWADGKKVLAEIEKQLDAVLGPKTAEDEKPLPKSKPKEKKDSVPTTQTAPTPVEAVTLSDSVKFHRPEENYQLRPEILERHLAETGGQIRTRFPPEPNGYLHIGHAKSMNLNFGYAKKNNGICFLRFDDTNPETEKADYIRSIIEDAQWMGHTPYRVTHSSDYFQQLYDYAVQLIKKGKAYICHQTAEEMHKGREEMTDSPWRDRPIEESLKLFEDMKNGKIEEGKATLRLRCDMKSPNPTMRDIVAYRIKFIPHPQTGDKWCIYPSYDYTHCICDSIENITHSLCTLEFEIRRELYNWILDNLEIYRPPQLEFSRLNVSNTVLSKRKLIKLVGGGHVSGWDDPRLSTIMAFRRKGYTPEAINYFCEKVGITRNASHYPYSFLEECCRQELDAKVPRVMAVLHPLLVTVSNYPEGQTEQLVIPNHPRLPEHGNHEIKFGRQFYIDRSDFRAEDSKDYFGLAPNKEVRLKYAYNIRCTEVKMDAENKEPVEIVVTYDKENTNKPKGNIHWVEKSTSEQIEVRLYEPLFLQENMADAGDDWLSTINPNSLQTIPHARISLSTYEAKPESSRFQFERVGYFIVDKDTTAEKKVFNRIVTLKDTFHGKK